MAAAAAVVVETPPWQVFTRALAAIERVSPHPIRKPNPERPPPTPPLLHNPPTTHTHTQSDVRALRELYDQYGKALTNRMLPDGTGAFWVFLPLVCSLSPSRARSHHT